MESLTTGSLLLAVSAPLLHNNQSPSTAGQDKNYLQRDLFWTMVSVYNWLTSLTGEY